MRARHATQGARRRTWRQDPEGRRTRILDAAAEEFARQGFRLARLDRIARAAGVAEGTVYHQFGSKQGLLEAVGARYGMGLAAAAFAGIRDDPSLEEIEGMVRNIFGYVRRTDGALAVFLLAHDPLEGGPAQDANRSQMLAAIEERMRRRIGPAAFDPRVAAELQFGLVESALRDCFLRRGGRDEERYIREVVRCLGAYLAAIDAAAPRLSKT